MASISTQTPAQLKKNKARAKKLLDSGKSQKDVAQALFGKPNTNRLKRLMKAKA